MDICEIASHCPKIITVFLSIIHLVHTLESTDYHCYHFVHKMRLKEVKKFTKGLERWFSVRGAGCSQRRPGSVPSTHMPAPHLPQLQLQGTPHCLLASWATGTHVGYKHRQQAKHPYTQNRITIKKREIL